MTLVEPIPTRRPRPALRRFWAQRTGPVAAVLVGVVLLVAIFAPWLVGYDPYTGGADALFPPLSDGHVLGTDALGRDLWAEIAFGARVSITVGLVSAASSLVIGIAIGAISGYAGGWTDAVLMRISEFFQTLPRFVLALIAIAILGGGIEKVIAVIGLLSWPQTARVVRASFSSLREAGFVEAARVGGMPHSAVILREILPNVVSPIVVMGSLDVATAILLEVGLSFFGLGDPNHVSWGMMLNDAQQYLRTAWWMAAFPGLAIVITVLGFNLLGDALNDALNPRGRG